MILYNEIVVRFIKKYSAKKFLKNHTQKISKLSDLSLRKWCISSLYIEIFRSNKFYIFSKKELQQKPTQNCGLTLILSQQYKDGIDCTKSSNVLVEKTDKDNIWAAKTYLQNMIFWRKVLFWIRASSKEKVFLTKMWHNLLVSPGKRKHIHKVIFWTSS